MNAVHSTIDLTLPVGQRDHRQGLLMAPVVLVEYGDYQCSYCAQATSIIQELQYQLGDRLCYVFRHFPLAKIHPQAIRAAEAAEAAAAQDQFWQMHYCLLAYQSALNKTDLLQYARDLALDIERFEHDINSNQRLQHIREDIRTGIDSGVDRTPTFFINGVHYAGNWDLNTLMKVIGQHYTN
jgi:protein-disulfide isomerase